MVAVCPGFNVSGAAIPVAPNREPTIEIDETVTGAVPEEVKVTACVPARPTAMFPNDTVDVLRVSAATPPAGVTVIWNDCVVVPDCAVMVAICTAVTLAMVA
jgi:hypothetical protein